MKCMSSYSSGTFSVTDISAAAHELRKNTETSPWFLGVLTSLQKHNDVKVSDSSDRR